jgi:hypothetical protein
MIATHAPTQIAWLPVDTIPDLIRHGETPSVMTFSVADPSNTPALLRFTLFDTDGKEQGRYEQILPIGTQRTWSLADLFDVEKFRGSMRLWSDVPIAISDTRATISVRGEPVENEIGYFDGNATGAKDAVELPAIFDGGGIATGIVLINPADAEAKGVMQFESSDGHPSDIVLR